MADGRWPALKRSGSGTSIIHRRRALILKASRSARQLVELWELALAVLVPQAGETVPHLAGQIEQLEPKRSFPDPFEDEDLLIEAALAALVLDEFSSSPVISPPGEVAIPSIVQSGSDGDRPHSLGARDHNQLEFPRLTSIELHVELDYIEMERELMQISSAQSQFARVSK